MARQLILGPQRPVRNLGEAAASAELGDGPVAVISAGWQEAEGDIDEVRELIGRPLIDLGLYQRAERLFGDNPAFRDCYRERQDRLIELQRLYRLRLKHLMLAARQTLRADADADMMAAEARHAVSQLRALDRHHMRRVRRNNAAFAGDLQSRGGTALAAQIAAVEDIVAQCDTLLVTGGNVVVLLNRLQLFGLQATLRSKHVIAWSAGAMALCRQIVLFHDRTPEGRRDPELLGAGAGVLPGYVFLPDARRRLRTSDTVRTGLLSRRFSPAACVTLDSGAQLLFEDGELISGGLARRVTKAGHLTRVARR